MTHEQESAVPDAVSLREFKERHDLLKVRNSEVVMLQSFADYPDGDLHIAEVFKNLPFSIKRIYWINNLANSEAIRGKHAHRRLKQAIFCVNGSFTLDLDDGRDKQAIKMDAPNVGIVLGRLLWHEMKDFSQDCVILVVASEYYDPKDYIRDYKEFQDVVSD